MWVAEHSVETTASAEAVWHQWTGVDRWPVWNSDIEEIEIDGPFAVGSRITMTPVGQEAIVLRIAEARAPELFVDEADFGDIVVRTTHQVESLPDEPSRIVYQLEITGPAADTVGPELGPQISADFPEVLAALSRRAEAGRER